MSGIARGVLVILVVGALAATLWLLMTPVTRVAPLDPPETAQAPKDAKVLSKPFHLRDLVNEVQKMLTAA
jgi:hypothetical protein